MFEFDIQGNIIGNKIHEINITDFANQFVKNVDNSDTRNLIFDEFIKLVEDIKIIVNQNFYLLVDDSFVSKKVNPNDIDFVIIISFDLLENDLILKMLKEKFYISRKNKTKILDFYIIQGSNNQATYEQKNKFKNQLSYWVEFFSKTRIDEFGFQHNKSILKINL